MRSTPTAQVGLCVELEESTSASALLLSSIDGARRQFVRDGHELLERGQQSARLLRARLAAEVPELEVVSSEELASRPGVSGADPTHVLIETAPVGRRSAGSAPSSSPPTRPGSRPSLPASSSARRWSTTSRDSWKTAGSSKAPCPTLERMRVVADAPGAST